MVAPSWPSAEELDGVKRVVSEMSGRDASDVRIVVSPYRICPLGAHIDHQGGNVLAMTINRGIILGFVSASDGQVLLRSGQFQGEVKFRVDEEQYPRSSISGRKRCSLKQDEADWGCYARGAIYALKRGGRHITKGIIGYICGSAGLDSSGLSSSAAVGIAYLLALQSSNGLTVSAIENIEFDRLIENGYLGLRNGILDQSAILLSKDGYLTCMNCKTKEYSLIKKGKQRDLEAFKILLAFSGLKFALPTNSGYNCRVSECREAARFLLCASGMEKVEPLLCNVAPETYETYKDKLEENLARRAEHYFSENTRVQEGLKAWESGNLTEFGRLISASGLSSIKNYECGCEPMIQLYEILLKAPGIFGARFSGAGFRGCCLALVDAHLAEEAGCYVKREYEKAQPELVSQFNQDNLVLICEAGDCARIL